MEQFEPDEIEDRVHDHLAALMDLSTAAEAEQVRRDVVDLGPVVNRLDSRVPRLWAIRQLYGYVDWRSRESTYHERKWLVTEQAAIDRALLSVLDQSRPGRTAQEVERARAGLDVLRERIDQLERGAEQADALRALWGYAEATSAAALERAELTERPQLTQEHNMLERPTVTLGWEPPEIEMEL